MTDYGHRRIATHIWGSDQTGALSHHAVAATAWCPLVRSWPSYSSPRGSLYEARTRPGARSRGTRPPVFAPADKTARSPGSPSPVVAQADPTGRRIARPGARYTRRELAQGLAR